MKKAQPTDREIKDTMGAYVKEKSAETGFFEIFDNAAGKLRRLKLKRIHDRVGKTGEFFYSCADFMDSESGQILNLDIDVENKDGILTVVDVRIHKVAGKPRYTYDKNDKRIPAQCPVR